MRNYFYVILWVMGSVFLPSSAFAQSNYDKSFYQEVKTYVNPTLPGDHPDPTLLKVGNDFYHCGSTFHFNPFMPIYHSTDLVHWEIIARVLPPEKAGWVSDRPSSGIWQGAITYFYGSYWIYFSAGGQWFCKADSPKGPWSSPVEVKTNKETGPLGYDNSIFVDDDGKPYMVIKNGQLVNRIQEIGKDGQLTAKVMNLDWINGKKQYSWAEGPVMSRSNGYYYYYPAGDVSGGQYLLRSKELTADSSKWERLGNFFQNVTDPNVGFRRPNHMSAPVQLADGSWWTIAQSYEKYDNVKNDWSGTGRQTSLYPLIWEGNRPWGMAPTTQPIVKPNLPQSGILWRSVQSDYFESPVLSLNWHFLTKKAAASYSLTERKGWIRLKTDSLMTHLVQKETDHFYTAVTKVDLNSTNARTKAGIYLTNGNQRTFVRLYTGFDSIQKVIFNMDKETRSVPNTAGNVVWLKVERNEHNLTGYYSADGEKWISVGAPISAVNLDKTQPNNNSWVGTSVGLFTEGKSADFDFFVCKDGYSTLPAIGYSNYFGVKNIKNETFKAVTNTSSYGGWFMISGVELGKIAPSAIQVVASSAAKGNLEIWLDDLKNGKLIATVPVTATGENVMSTFTTAVKGLTGHHDVFVKFPTESEGKILIQSVSFVKGKAVANKSAVKKTTTKSVVKAK
jgi:beta-xylosidase